MSAQSTTKQGIAGRAGGWSARHKKATIAGWLAFVVLAVVLGGMVGSNKLTEADSYAGESGRAEKTLEESFPEKAGENVLIQNSNLTADDPAFRSVVKDVERGVSQVDVVTNVTAATDRDAAGMVSKDGHSALVSFQIKGDPEAANDKIGPVLAAVDEVKKANPEFRIAEVGDASIGAELDKAVEQDLKKAETLSLPITLGILLFAFGALVAAGIPVLLAISAVLATIGLVSLPSQIFPIDENASIVITLIGMAVGVDYTMFYLKRWREERAAGRDDKTALAIASATSGRTILISGFTVMVAMAGQFLVGDKGATSFAVGTIMVVAVAMLGSITVLPATLALLGRHAEKGRIPFLGRRRSENRDSRLWGWILDRVLARPVLSVVVATAALLAVAFPVTHLKTHNTEIKDLPTSIKGVDDLQRLEATFPNNMSPAVAVVEADDVNSPAVEGAIEDLTDRALASGQVREPVEVDQNRAGTVATVSMPLAGDGSNAASDRALETLRNELIPATLGQVDGVTTNVTGQTALDNDSSDRLIHSTPLVFGFVLSLAFVLMLVTFRSIVIPIKAIVLNLLSVGAAYGVLVAVFQDGYGASQLGLTVSGGVAPWLPLFLFVILFGLSMDYHVFILSRVKELVDGGMRTDEAVAHGIKSTAGVVTSAAMVMVGVFSIFATLSIVDLQQFGIGLAAAVLIDATIIRAVLLPATMKLLGDWNWYFPKRLGWLPTLRHEGGAPEPQPAAA